jgi:hypothetical protein
MNTINPLSGITPVGTATSDSGGKGRESQIRQGRLFRATVLEAKSANTFVLEIGGNKITAQTRTPLSIGQSLNLQVLSTSPQVELQIVSDSTRLLAGKSITLLGDGIDIKGLFTLLRTTAASPLAELQPLTRNTLQTFSLINQEMLAGKDGGNLLKQLLDRLGLSFETLLARGDTRNAQNSLKAALLELSQAFKGAGQLAETTNKLISTIELYQLTQLQLEKQNIFIFPLPLPFLQKGYLLIEDYRRGKADESDAEDTARYSLHLALQGLGNLRIDIFENHEGLFLRFVSDSKEKISFLEQFKDDLLLNMVDKNIAGVSFVEEQTDPAADLLKRILPEGESLVNTKV